MGQGSVWRFLGPWMTLQLQLTTLNPLSRHSPLPSLFSSGILEHVLAGLVWTPVRISYGSEGPFMLLQRINGIASPALRQLTREDRDEPWLHPSDMASCSYS